MTGVSSLSLNILTPAMPSLVTRFATDPATVQLTVSLYIMGPPRRSWCSGRYRTTRPPPGGIIGFALATVASTSAIFAGSIASLVIWRVVQSLGASTGQTIGRAIIRDLYERDRASSMIGLVTSVVVLMPMVALLMGGIDTLLGWEAIHLLSALSGCVRWLRTVVPAERNRFRSDFRALATNPRFFGYAFQPASGPGRSSAFARAAVVVSMPDALANMASGSSCRRLASWQATSRRLARRFGIDALIWWELRSPSRAACQRGGVRSILMEMARASYPQIIIGREVCCCRPRSPARSASARRSRDRLGMTGFVQMAIGASAAQLSGHGIAGATSAMPMLLLMLGFGLQPQRLYSYW
jgi:DHA1 family bicyclomycin/chloramphenicol resistance-like MFS transporter